MSTLLLLDLDGTLIDTPHFEAWSYAARQFGMKDLAYDEYIAYMAGRPRLEGASRLIELRKHCPQPALVGEEACSALAEIKQLEFLRLCADVRLFDDARRLLERLERSQQRVKFYSASRNAESLFHAALFKSGGSLSRPAIVHQRSGQTREELFAHLAQGYAVECVALVDDAPHAVDAACHLGIRAYQICRSESQTASAHLNARILRSLDGIDLPIGN
jgi:beta-phosphoglucomutase-like phosphatase (HAD superfamily)